MPDMQEIASHHANDLATPGFTAKLKDHISQDVLIDNKTQDELQNGVLNDKLKPYRPNIFQKLWHSPFQNERGGGVQSTLLLSYHG